MTAVMFIGAAALGAATRQAINLRGWAWRGTLLANVAGSFLLGLLVASGPSASVATVVGTGYLGSLTTFSTFALEASQGRTWQRIAVVTSNLTLALLAATFGYQLA